VGSQVERTAQVVPEFIQRVDLGGAIDIRRVTALDVAIAVGVIAAAMILAGVARRFIRRRVETWEQAPDYAAPVAARFASWTVIVVGIVIAVDFLGVDLNSLLVFFLIATVILAFAARDMLRNMAAASVLQTRGPFHVGDQIRFGDHEGTVDEINARVTVFTTVDGQQVFEPNIDILNGTLVNLTSLGGRRSSLGISVAYGSDLRSAQRIMESAMRSLDVVHDESPPRSLVTEFGDSAIEFELRFWHGPQILEAQEARSAVAIAVREALDEQGIVLAFPQRVLSLSDPTDEFLREAFIGSQ
jgi:small conductance mechanosensitive channel